MGGAVVGWMIAAGATALDHLAEVGGAVPGQVAESWDHYTEEGDGVSERERCVHIWSTFAITD